MASWETYNYDPAKVLEIQASYLRFLASLYPAGSPPNVLNPNQEISHQSNNTLHSPVFDLISLKSPLGNTIRSMSPPLSSRREARDSPTRDERPRNPYDELPVKQVHKTFEQLLEEQLTKETGNKIVPLKREEKAKTLTRDVTHNRETTPKRDLLKKKLTSSVTHIAPRRSLDVKLSNIVKPIEKEEIKEREKSPGFLKRGHGQLCSQIRAISSPRQRQLKSLKRSSSQSSTISQTSTKNTPQISPVKKPFIHTDKERNTQEQTELSFQIEKFKQESFKLKVISDELERRKKKIEDEEKAFQAKRKKEIDDFEN